MIETEINLTKGFLFGQLELYKIEFAETDNNKYLEAMNELNKAIKLIDKLHIVATKSYQSEMKTKREIETMQKLSDANKSKSFFYAKGIKFQLTGTYRSKDKSLWMHDVKNTVSGETKTISDVKYLEIISKFKEANKHLR